jgi:hypothetical protein
MTLVDMCSKDTTRELYLATNFRKLWLFLSYSILLLLPTKSSLIATSNIGKISGFKEMEDWYKITNKQFDGEQDLLKKFRGSAQFAVMGRHNSFN